MSDIIVEMSIKERIKNTKERKRPPKPLSENVFESALLLIKDVFSEETYGTGDTDFWIEIEDKAKVLPNQAIFELSQIRGFDHVKLTRSLLKYFEPVRNLPKDEFDIMVERAAPIIFKECSDDYKKQFEKKK